MYTQICIIHDTLRNKTNISKKFRATYNNTKYMSDTRYKKAIENSHEVLEFEIQTLPIREGYQLITYDDSVIGGVIVGTFISALQTNDTNETIGVQVVVDRDPDNIKVVLEDDIQTVHNSNGTRTWERVEGGDFVSSMAIATTRSLLRIT